MKEQHIKTVEDEFIERLNEGIREIDDFDDSLILMSNLTDLDTYECVQIMKVQRDQSKEDELSVDIINSFKSGFVDKTFFILKKSKIRQLRDYLTQMLDEV